MVRLMEIGGYDRVIAFCNTKNMTDRLSGLLRMRNISCEACLLYTSPRGCSPRPHQGSGWSCP